MAGLQARFGIRNAMVLMYDPGGARLYTVASCGYAESGVGSEVPLGAGVIGVAAQQRTPIRISYMTSDYAYSRAVRQNLAPQTSGTLETEIPFPGLTTPQSQMALPMMWGDGLLGVLYVESMEEMRFSHQDEDALMALADQVAMAIHFITQQSGDVAEERTSAGKPAAPLRGTAMTIRRFPPNDSVFIDDDYLIKGVAGAIFWKLVNDYVQHQRTEFTNRELRLSPALRLPDISDNLEARLILLQRRLNERCPFLRIVKTGRGRFSLLVERPIELADQVGA